MDNQIIYNSISTECFSSTYPFINKYLIEFGDFVESRNGDTKEILNFKTEITNPYKRCVGNNNRDIKVFSNKNMIGVSELSFSIVFNPENVSISKIYSTTLPSKITNIANESGLSTLLIQLDKETDISSGQEILSIEVEK